MTTTQIPSPPAPSVVQELLGREDDCRAIDELLDGARAGRGGALVLWGEPGIGKTALLRHAADRAGTMTVLSARGIESESELPFAGLSEILRPIIDDLPTLPARQASALAGALAIGPPTGADPFAIGTATLSLVAAASAVAPLLVVVDDLQWIDASSAEALLFAARRIGEEPVAMLFAMRDGGQAQPPSLGVPTLALRGLARPAALRLLAAHLPTAIAPDLADRLVAETGGNPLAIIEIPDVLERELLEGGVDLREEPLPLGERLKRAFADRVAMLPRRTQTSLLVIAANDAPEVEPALRALAILGLDADDLGAAEATGLLVGDGSQLGFRHPLIRSAVYHGAEPALRRRVHRGLAEALTDSRPDLAARRAWHLALATMGQDEAVASTLEEVAVAARHRSGYAAAARAYERAARLSSSPEARARRLLSAAQAWQLANRYGHAMALLDEAARLTADRLLAADIDHQRALVNTWRGPALDASRQLRKTAESLRDISPGRAAAMLADATLASITGGDIAGARATAEQACEIAADVGGTTAVLATLQLGKARILTGHVDTGYPLLMDAVSQLIRDDPEAHGADLVQAAPALLAVEEYDLAADVLGRVITAERAAYALGQLAYSLGALSELDARVGRWVVASANGSEAVELAREAGQAGQLSYNLARLARLDAAQGRDELCRSRVAEALVLAERYNFGSALPFAHSALGLDALSQGRLPEAVLALEETQRHWLRIGLRDPGRLEWQEDLVEALVRGGDRARAEVVLADLEARADACVRVAPHGRPGTACTLARGAAARCRGLVAGATEVDDLFETALAWHRWTSTPFEEARTELCYGEQLRRHGRRVEARVHLRAALGTFDRLAAGPWSDRARAELAATGETVAARKPAPTAVLTPQELQVALLVGTGATNREAGASLFLTPKTIEFHLAKIYRKLDLRSRTELAHWLAGHETAASGGAGAATTSRR